MKHKKMNPKNRAQFRRAVLKAWERSDKRALEQLRAEVVR